ncbi:MAG: efflux RND transporter permease subunit [Candidatus Kapabacteria bacterium]|nr:efflux RND transporter permease subunit [Candidatus Kapabacteria bacterium]
MTITELSIKRPTLIIVIFGVMIIAGIFAYFQLSYELMPDFSQPVLTIKTMYPGASPEEVETAVTKKIENAMSNLDKVDFIVSKSMNNASVVIVNFRYGVDINFAIQDAQRFIENIKKDLPDDILPPSMSKLSVNDLPIIQISATSNIDESEFYIKMRDNFLPEIQQIKGVAEISVLGAVEREIQVKIDKDKLKLYNLSILQVSEAINRSSMEIPAGKIKSTNGQMTVKLNGKFSTIYDLKNQIIAMPAPGQYVYLKDIADVKDGFKEIASVSRFNGKNGLGLLLKKQPDANAVDVSESVEAKLIELEKRNSEIGLQFIIADNSTDITIEAVEAVVTDLGLAVLLVSLVMLLFLHSLRNSLIILVAIPASLISAFATMWFLDYTLNLMTLLAMSLIIGILVDDSIVVLENIQRYLDKGHNKKDAALKGRAEIGFSALSITLVDVVVFLPIIFVQVFVADLLKQFSVIVVVSTLMSLFVSFTLTPWLASRIGKKEELLPSNFINKLLIGFEHQIDEFTNWYGDALKWVLNHKLIFSGIIILLFVATGLIMKMGIMSTELIATGDQGKFSVKLEYDKKTSISQNNLVTNEIEDFILSQKEVKSVFSNVGGPTTGMAALGIGEEHKSELTVNLTSKKERKNEPSNKFMVNLRENLQEKFPGIDFKLSAIGLVAKQAPIEITLSGANLDLVKSEAIRIKNMLQNVPGADNVSLSVQEGNPEVQVNLDRDKMARFGLNTALVGATLRNAFTGNDDAVMTDNGIEFPIRIWLDNFNRQNIEDVKSLLITNQMSKSIRLDQFADVYETNSPTLLERKDRISAVTITADALGIGSGTVANTLIDYLKNEPVKEGVIISWGGDIKRQNDSFSALSVALIASFILVYLIMVALYNSFLYPFVVLFSIPVAAIGAFLALNLSMSNMSLFTILGLIMLLGLVAKNAILIVDFTNQLKEKGMHYSEALIISGKTRLRPIMMTTISMIIGMLPIALASGTASEWKNGLAWAIIGGLTSSMVLTVFLVPVVYYFVDSIKERFAQNKLIIETKQIKNL